MRRFIHNCRRQVLPTLQAFQDLPHAFHQQCAVANQLVAAFGAGVVDRAGNGVNLTALLGGQTGCDQRTAGQARLNHQHTE
ncbi:hypothetical protein D3C73_1592300 [compost metagenome]